LTACSLALKPSWTLAALLSVLHGMALCAAFVALSGFPLALVGFGVLVSCVVSLADALQGLPASVAWLELQEDGTGRWRDKKGREHPVRAARGTWVSPELVILGLVPPRGRTRWLVLLPDSAAGEALRGLRVWLRWRPA
jgi:hypothetical protein